MLFYRRRIDFSFVKTCFADSRIQDKPFLFRDGCIEADNGFATCKSCQDFTSVILSPTKITLE